MAPADDDISIEEKRVYTGTSGRTDAYVATGIGVVRVAISADKVGAFNMVSRETARDVAVLPRRDTPNLVAVATPEGLLVSTVTDDLVFKTIETGSAVAVGVHDEALLVADESGAIDRVELDHVEVGDNQADGDKIDATVTRIGSVSEPTAVDGPLVAAADGVHRVIDGDGAGYDIVSVGLDDALDVAGRGVPLAATATGLYWLGNGWMTAKEGETCSVAADGDDHAMAAVEGDLFIRTEDTATDSGWNTDSWTKTELPVDERVVALGYGTGLSVAVTAAGTLCVDAGDGWRHQVIGVREVSGIALAAVE